MNIDFSNLKPGHVVRFHYSLGSRNGYRVVEVKEVKGCMLHGIDLEKPTDSSASFRNYNQGAIIGPIELVAEANESVTFINDFVHADKYPSVTPEQALAIFKLLNPEDTKSRVNSNAKVIVTPRPDLPRVEVEIKSGVIGISFFDASGSRSGFSLKHGEKRLRHTTIVGVLKPEEYAAVTQAVAAQQKPAKDWDSLYAQRKSLVATAGV
jgi:hypothetical protein